MRRRRSQEDLAAINERVQYQGSQLLSAMKGGGSTPSGDLALDSHGISPGSSDGKVLPRKKEARVRFAEGS